MEMLFLFLGLSPRAYLAFVLEMSRIEQLIISQNVSALPSCSPMPYAVLTCYRGDSNLSTQRWTAAFSLPGDSDLARLPDGRSVEVCEGGGVGIDVNAS